MAEFHFHLEASWPGGRNEIGTITSGQLQTKVSIPEEMGGPGVGTNPDEMLLGAAGTCYIITLAAMIERAQLSVKQLTMTSQAIVEVNKGKFTYKQITHRPIMLLRPDHDLQTQEKLHKLALRADAYCMISNAVRRNVQMRIEPSFAE